MKALQEEHAAQKREVGLTGLSWVAWLPMTSLHPSAPHPLPPALNWLADILLLIWFLVAEPRQYKEGQLPRQLLPWLEAGASRPSLLNPAHPLSFLQ